MEKVYDFAIVGGGSTGVSAAFELKQTFSTATVIMIESPETQTSSKGICRIVRTPYHVPEYVKLAEEAKEKWEREPLYNQHYHRPGWVQVVRGDNYSPFHDQEQEVEADFVSGRIHSRHSPKIEEGERLWYNADIGVADAASSVEAVAQQASKLGVVRYTTDVATLLIENNVCVGVQCVNGVTIQASMTIVATGPWTPELLERSNIPIPNGTFRVTATSVAWVPLTESEYKKFAFWPIVTTELGEIMRAVKQRVLHITSTKTFPIHSPQELKSGDVSAERLELHRALLRKLIPDFQDRRLESAYYPELMMLNADPLIDEIPGISKMIVAAGFSYHGFKFLPVVGKLVVDCIHGGARRGALARMGWNRMEEKISAHSEVLPKE